MTPTDRAALPRGNGLLGIVVGAAALFAIALLAPTSAVAHSKKAKDGRGDFQNLSGWDYDDMDIVKVKHAHKGGNKLKHMVKVAGQSSHPTPRSGEPGPPILVLDTRPGGGEGCSQFEYYAGDSEADYVIAAVTRGSKPSLIDCRTGNGASVKSRKRGERKLVFVFKTAKIGDPSRYGWYAHNYQDVAPDDTHWLGHRLDRGSKNAKRRWKECGDLQEQGAGAYDVRARKVGCRKARRLADRFMTGGGDGRYGGWRCRSERAGEEDWKAKCVKRKNGKRKVVKFRYGA